MCTNYVTGWFLEAWRSGSVAALGSAANGFLTRPYSFWHLPGHHRPIGPRSTQPPAPAPAPSPSPQMCNFGIEHLWAVCAVHVVYAVNAMPVLSMLMWHVCRICALCAIDRRVRARSMCDSSQEPLRHASNLCGPYQCNRASCCVPEAPL